MLLPRREGALVVTQSSVLWGWQQPASQRQHRQQASFSWTPSPRRGIVSWDRGLTAVALGILWDSAGRRPTSHRPPRAHLRNLLVTHCHTPGGLAGEGTIASFGPQGSRLGRWAFLARPAQRSASSHMCVCLPGRSSGLTVAWMGWAESSLVSDLPASPMDSDWSLPS